MDKNQKTILALALLVVGILFIIFQSSIISVVVTIAGAALVVLGVIDLFHKNWAVAIAKLIVGILIIVFAWLFETVMLYVLGALLILYGIYLVYMFLTNKSKPKDVLSIIIEIALPILSIAVGILIFFKSGIVFTIAGILLIIASIVMLLQQFVFKKQ